MSLAKPSCKLLICWRPIALAAVERVILQSDCGIPLTELALLGEIEDGCVQPGNHMSQSHIDAEFSCPPAWCCRSACAPVHERTRLDSLKDTVQEWCKARAMVPTLCEVHLDVLDLQLGQTSSPIFQLSLSNKLPRDEGMSERQSKGRWTLIIIDSSIESAVLCRMVLESLTMRGIPRSLRPLDRYLNALSMAIFPAITRGRRDEDKPSRTYSKTNKCQASEREVDWSARRARSPFQSSR